MSTVVNSKPLARAFYERDTLIVARELLGKYIVRQIQDQLMVGKIVETECYRAHDDPACHGFKGVTPRTKSLFGPAGHAYIYFIYGNHYCFNAVSHEQNFAGGVLIRAIEPVAGIEFMHHYRPNIHGKQLTNGPGKLAQALQIDRQLYGADLTYPGSLYITPGEIIADKDIVATSRVGLSIGLEKEWRFYIKNNIFVSKM